MLIDVGGNGAGINKSRMVFDSITEHVGLAKLLTQSLGRCVNMLTLHFSAGSKPSIPATQRKYPCCARAVYVQSPNMFQGLVGILPKVQTKHVFSIAISHVHYDLEFFSTKHASIVRNKSSIPRQKRRNTQINHGSNSDDSESGPTSVTVKAAGSHIVRVFMSE